MPTTGKTWKSKNRYNRGSSHPRSVLTEADIHIIRELLKSGRSYQQIGIRYGVGKQAIYLIAKGINWTHV